MKKRSRTTRKRRTAYRSGRREVIGMEKQPFRRQLKFRRERDRTPPLLKSFRSDFRWRKH